MARMELGIALSRAGRGEQALQELRHAVALKPDLPGAWRALGDHLSAMGDGAGADAAYNSHIRYSITDPRLLAAGVGPLRGAHCPRPRPCFART